MFCSYHRQYFLNLKNTNHTSTLKFIICSIFHCAKQPLDQTDNIKQTYQIQEVHQGLAKSNKINNLSTHKREITIVCSIFQS